MPVLEQVLEKNPETVKVVFKHFPLKSHKYALKASLAALSAGNQGKFWPFHDRLFKSYNQLNDNKIRQIAKETGLNLDTFMKEWKDPSATERIRRDVQEGVKAGVRGTPTIFVNGQRLKDRSPDGFQIAIGKALEKKKNDD